MALSTADQRASYPLAAYNFRVTLDGVSMRFSKVSGLNREYKTVTYRDGLSFKEGEHITRYFVDAFRAVTLEQGTVIGSKGLLDWLEDGTARPLEVSLCDAQGVPVIAWRIAKAVPVKLVAPTFDARSNESAVDTLEVQAAGITIIHH